MMLIEEWGTSGRKRATVNDLFELLIRVELYRAADFVATDILQETPPERPNSGPGAKIDIFLPPEEIDEEQMNEILQNVDYPNTSNLLERNASHINNINRDYNNSNGSNDFVKIINGYASSSDDCPYMSDSQSDHDTDLINFSAEKDRTQKSQRSVFQSDNNDGVYGSYSDCLLPNDNSSTYDKSKLPDFENLRIHTQISDTSSESNLNSSVDTENYSNFLPNIPSLMNGS